MTSFICSCRRGKLANFYATNIFAEKQAFSFLVTNKSCHIRKIARVANQSINHLFIQVASSELEVRSKSNVPQYSTA